MDLTQHGRQQVTDWLTGNPSTPPGGLWVQLHIGDPGDFGTANMADETRRRLTTWGVADASGLAYSSSDLDWLSVSASETYTHLSLWDSDVGGNAWLKGLANSPIPVIVSSDFQIPTGSATIQNQ